MSSLIPAHASNHVISGVTEYLTTSFSLADTAAAAELSDFLGAPGTGMFRGPYVRTRLPYAPANDTGKILDWSPAWFTPYHHQAVAFRRLKSVDDAGHPRRPDPTLVVTGTGSGKTESFLYPILDHVIRERAKGRTGTKALILYPMNALANDQANRLAELIAGPDADPSLSTVTAGIYTGETRAGGVVRVTEKSLITSQETIRKNPPDILLTNYKMLDQLLLRSADAGIWKQSAESLQYLVLDEFHTYDGAQGTDVALLLRRLGLTLKSHQRDGFLTADEERRALGRVTPVATSATLGDGDDTSPMVDFADTVFGEKIPDDAVVREKLLTLSEWRRSMRISDGRPASDSAPVFKALADMPDASTIEKVNTAMAERVDAGSDYVTAVHEEYCREILHCSPERTTAVATYPHHALTGAIIDAATTAIALTPRHTGDKDNLVHRVLGSDTIRSLGEESAAEFITHALTFIANLRAEATKADGWHGKRLPGVENHLWVREVSRVDRAAGPGARFRWADDGEPTDSPVDDDEDAAHTHWLPACYCRNCGRSGWMIQVAPGTGDPVLEGPAIRTGSLASKEHQRPLLDATSEEREARNAGRPAAGPRSADGDSAVMWLNPGTGTLNTVEPSEQDLEEGNAIPVLTYHGADEHKHALEERCPSCGEADAIRFLGSSVATLLSVALSNLFGMPDLAAEEKKTLIFADSVQDAAHRAAFVQSRSRAFALRTHTRRVIGDAPVQLSELPEALIAAAGDDDRARYELLPPDIADYSQFKPFWAKDAAAAKRRQAASEVQQRLALDLALEFGDRADLARSLTMTGSLSVAVDAPPAALRAAANDALAAVGGARTLEFGGDADVDVADAELAWARGVLEMARVGGAVKHRWFDGYLDDDCNPYLLNRREARSRGIPGFPRGGAPDFPRVGPELSPAAAKSHQYVPIASPRSGYAHWTSRLLGLGRHDAASAVVALFKELQRRGIVDGVRTRTGAMVYAITPERISVRVEDEPATIECSVCRAGMGVTRDVRDALTGSPCTSIGCTGHMQQAPIDDNYYRRLYSATEPRTVIAREHTSLLAKEERLAYENAFRGAEGATDPDAPNVLVATPTLEMGIDIGDLSAVMLASMPQSVASYVQRVGRAGRLSGNSLIVALMQGRGSVLAKLDNPLDVIAGDVVPPVAFLSATEILRRQFTAHLLDQLPLDSMVPGLRRASDVFGAGDNLVGAVVEYIAANPDGVRAAVRRFQETIRDHVDMKTLGALESWAVGTGANTLTHRLRDVQTAWNAERAILVKRRRVLEEKVAELSAQAETRKDDDDLRDDLRATRAALGHTKRQLREVVLDEYWIASMERHGLLPNFTLLDDSVTLKLAVSFLDPQTMEFDTERREYARGVSSALHELVPGATFYAQGIAATIDSVDIGDAGSEIQSWRVCPSCSHAAVIHDTGAPVGACPVCGDATYADRRQIIPVVPLTRVSAQADRTRNAIGDRFEDRRSPRFHMAMTCTIPEGSRGTSWYLPGGFGIEHLEDVELRWLNLGRGPGEPRYIAGSERTTPLFRVCRHCGHIDSEAGSNSKWDHAPWCRHRDEPEEDTVSFALGRTLRTQGVLMHLPPLIAAGVNSAVPSVIAAIKLGFKEVLGGDPQHLAVATVTVGSDTGPIEALLLHDTIAGGTGYLTQFTSPEKVRDLLLRAWRRVAAEVESPSDGPGCLTPYVDYRSLNTVTAAAAESALRRILTGNSHALDDADDDPEASVWRPQSQRPETDDASKLEIRFRKAIRDGLASRSIQVQERTRNGRVELEFNITHPMGADNRWRLYEQHTLPGTTPDFYLENVRMGTRPIAIYLDGYAYHASQANMRVPDDLAKRRRLHEADGMIPWTITYADMDWYDETVSRESTRAPRWYRSEHKELLTRHFTISSESLRTLRSDPVTQLFDYLTHPSWPWERISQAAMMMVVLGHSPERGAGGMESSLMRGLRASINPADHMRVVVALDGAMWLDGTDESLRRDSWNMFWNLANLAWLRENFVEVTLDNEPSFHAVSGSGPEAAVGKQVRPGTAADIVGAVGTADESGGALFQKVLRPSESGDSLFDDGLEPADPFGGDDPAAADAAAGPDPMAAGADEAVPDAADAAEETPSSGPETPIADEWRTIIDEFDPDDADDAVIHACFTGFAAGGVPAPDEYDTEIGGAPVLALWSDGGVAITESGGETLDILSNAGISGMTVDDAADVGVAGFMKRLAHDNDTTEENDAR